MIKDKLHFLSPLFLKYQSDFEKNPRSRVFAPLAEAYRKVGMHDRAIEVLSQGIQYHPDYVMGHLGLAFCYYDLKQYNLSYSTLKPLIEHNRDNIRLLKLFSDSCLALDLKNEALDTNKYLLFVNPKDKDVAKIVNQLEKEIEEENRFQHRPIIIPAEELGDSEFQNQSPVNLFDVDRLKNSVKVDFDDWLHIDLNEKKPQIKDLNNENEWQVRKISDQTPQIDFEYKSEAEVIQEKSLAKEEKKTEAALPFVTHTLVDLYLGQGHMEKALEILEKIIQLNPNDKKTKDKILEIKHLMGEFAEAADLKLGISNNKPEIATEEDGRNHLMSILDEKVLTHSESHNDLTHKHFKNEEKIQKIKSKYNLFLKKIQLRALDYQNRF
jgi:tetratricopeptide (TPR) repeat protein